MTAGQEVGAPLGSSIGFFQTVAGDSDDDHVTASDTSAHSSHSCAVFNVMVNEHLLF